MAGTRIEGGLACLRDSHFQWAAAGVSDIHKGALCLHSLVRPVPGARSARMHTSQHMLC